VGALELRGVDPAVDRALDWASRLTWPPPPFTGPLRFIHQDLSPDHVIVDPDTGRITGILDWTDAILGDPARDFVFLVTWQGWQFAERVMREFGPSVDATYRERLRFMARLLSLVWLGESHARGENNAAHIASVQRAFSVADRI
jgi:aminoglycoside phosphotransferase (APT) family kinase protein